jgi:diguanylate cyclase (GGDEF)-like protein
MPGETILLADDDPQLLGLLTEFLQGRGYAVITAADGQQAMAAIQAQEFHLALLDLWLPGLSGLEMLSYLKSNYPHTEVIMVTGYAGVDTAVQALRLGAYDYLVKSGLHLPDLEAVVTRALERRRLARHNQELIKHLQQAREELTKRRADELAQIRLIGEVLACPLNWEQLFQGLLSLIWESLPLKVLALQFQGTRQDPTLEAYRRQPELTDADFQVFKNWFKERIHLVPPEQGGGEAYTPETAPQAPPLPAVLFEKFWADGVSALVAVGRDDLFTPEEVELLRIFTLQGQAALKNVVLFEEAQRLAVHDGLTGLYNHRHFWTMLDRELEVARRYGQPLSLVFLDIDDFKVINDTLGHPQGDEVLKALASFLEGAVRQADLVCRYGGEEFVVIMPQTTLEQALVSAERLRRAISLMVVPSPERNLQFTVSLGVATRELDMDGEALVRTADDALLKAKQEGKNRVCGPGKAEGGVRFGEGG